MSFLIPIFAYTSKLNNKSVMKNKYVKFENGRIVETNNENDIFLEWDGNYYIFYGNANNKYEYEGKTYDCFPIVTIDEGLGEVLMIEMFGCEGDKQNEDNLLLDMEFKVEDWKDCTEFYKLFKTQSEYALVGMLLHPEGNYADIQELVDEYENLCQDRELLIEALKTKFIVESNVTETRYGNAEYYFDEDGDGFYLYKFVRTLTDKE